MTNEIKDSAIVIKSIDHTESDKLITLFSLENGKIIAKIRGVKKNKAKLAFAAMPFCFGEYILNKKGDFFSIINCNSVDSFFYLTYDLNAYYAASTMLEVVNLLSRQNEKNSELFVLLLKGLKAACYSGKNAVIVLDKFLFNAVKLAGFEIELSKCTECGKITKSNLFSFENGSFICEKHSGVSYAKLTDEARELLINLGNCDFDSLPESITGSKSVLKLLLMYFEEKTGESLSCPKSFL